MIDQARISDRILDDGFGLEIRHNERSDTTESNQNGTSEFSHYGILGMKWGVRRTPEELGHKRAKKDRKYEDETPQEYQARMNRESAERTAKIQAKAKADSEKRAIVERTASEKRKLKSQEKITKMQLKSQEKEKAAIRKAQEKERKQQEAEQAKQRQQEADQKKSKTSGDVKSMTDQELRDAIVRLRAEKEYQQMMKKPDSLLTKTVKGVGKTAGGMLLQVGKNIAVKQLSDIGNAKADDYLKKKGLKKTTDSSPTDKATSENKPGNATSGSSVLNQLYLLEENNKR